MAEDIGNIYTTKIPAYEDSADIKAALRLYHYGQDTEPATVGDVPAESIAGYLIDLQDQIDAVQGSAGIQASIVDAKGDLIVASADNSVDNLPVGLNNQVLTADSSATLGVKWSPATDLVSAATTSSAGKVQLEDSISSSSLTKAATPNSVRVVADNLTTVSDSLTTLSNSVTPATKTSDYTLDSADAGKIIIMNVSSGTSVITIPTQVSEAFPDNARIDILQIGSVQTSFVAASGVTLSSKSGNTKLSGQYSAATLIKISNNSWVLIGDLGA